MSMYFSEKNSLRYARFSCFDLFPFVRAAFSTRIGGISEAPFDRLNLGMTTGDTEENVTVNRNRFFHALGIDPGSVVVQRQVHDTHSEYVDRSCLLESTDAAYTDQPNVFLTVSAADCVPVLFVEPQKKIVGVIHAGWKGTQKEIVYQTIEKVKKQYNMDGTHITAVIGPSISVNRYEVGEEVAGQFDPAFVVRDGVNKPHLDLWKANQAQLKKAGVVNTFVSGYCTFDRQDLFFSHRGSGGRSGRMLGVIGIL